MATSPEWKKGPGDSPMPCSEPGPRLEARGDLHVPPESFTADLCIPHVSEAHLANWESILGQQFQKNKKQLYENAFPWRSRSMTLQFAGGDAALVFSAVW